MEAGPDGYTFLTAYSATVEDSLGFAISEPRDRFVHCVHALTEPPPFDPHQAGLFVEWAAIR
jgi:hypothetical protein